jgi:hypothetical protein
MGSKLNDYLLEIQNYLPVKGAPEILREIRSHILERTADEFGSLDEENLAKAIDEYGSPRQVAEKYLEGCHVISPGFKKHLFVYSGLLFLVHAACILAAWAMGIEMLGLPFFYIPRFQGWETLFFLPLAYGYDFGLTALVLYLVTQKKWDLPLPWIGLKKRDRRPATPSQPKLWILVLLLLVLILIITSFVAYDTLFFISADFNQPQSLLDPSASLYFTFLLLALIGAEVFAYGIRLFHNHHLVILIKNGVVLILLWLAWNYPGPITINAPDGVEMLSLASTGLAVWTILAAYALFRSLVHSWRERAWHEGSSPI